MYVGEWYHPETKISTRLNPGNPKVTTIWVELLPRLELQLGPPHVSGHSLLAMKHLNSIICLAGGRDV